MMRTHAVNYHAALLMGTIGIIFAVDLLTPRGYAVWVMYAFPLFLLLRRNFTFDPVVTAALCGALIAIALPFKYADGTALPVSILNRIAAICVGFVIARLIRNEKEYRMRVSRSEATLRTVFRSAPAGMGIVSENRELILVNDAMGRITGYSSHELQGNNTRMLYFDDAEYEKIGRKKLESSDGMGITESVFRRKDGGAVNVYLSTALIDCRDPSQGYVFMALDITRQKRLEREIARERNIFRMLAQSSPDVIFLYDREMRFKYVNPSITRYTGFDPIHFLGKTIEEAGTPEELSRQWRREFKMVLETGKKRSFEFIYPSPAGERYFLETDIPIVSPDGSVENVVGFSHDITELKLFQKELEERVRERSRQLVSSQRQLEQARRLADIGSLAATVAHELRNPLGVIKTAAYNIRRKADGAPIGSSLENIDKKINQSDQIINNLLFYARLRKPHFERLDIHALIEETIDSFRKQPDGARIREDAGGLRGVRMEADPMQMSELLGNLISNARDAVSHTHGEITVAGSTRDGFVTIEIDDTGSGIERGDIDKIFEPFFSTKSKGTGLGLTVSKQIVALHNGALDVKSEKGKGTKVTVILPVIQPA